MYGSRKSKKIKPINPEEQPQVRQFILDSQLPTPPCDKSQKRNVDDQLRKELPVVSDEILSRIYYKGGSYK